MTTPTYAAATSSNGSQRQGDDLSVLAGIASGDQRVVRGLVDAEARRRAADAESERRLRERAERARLAREQRAAKLDQAARVRQERDTRREQAREAKQARQARRWAAFTGWLSRCVEHVRNDSVRAYCGVVYAMAVGGAVYGQLTNDDLGPTPVRVVIAVALEGLALAMALTALQQRLVGERALAARALTWVGALVAAGINLAGHWDNQVKATVLATLSLVGIVVWEIRSGAKHRAALRALGMIPPPPTQFGWRRWLRYPYVTWRAWSLDIRDRVTGPGAALLARVELERAVRRQYRHRRQVMRLARRAVRKTGRKNGDSAVLAPLVRLAASGAPPAMAAITATPAVTVMADNGTGHKTVARPDTADNRVPDTGPDTATPTVRTPKRTAGRTSNRMPVRTAVPDTTGSIAKLRDRYPGITQKDIADRLGISERTVRRHLNSGASNEGGQQ